MGSVQARRQAAQVGPVQAIAGQMRTCNVWSGEARCLLRGKRGSLASGAFSPISLAPLRHISLALRFPDYAINQFTRILEQHFVSVSTKLHVVTLDKNADWSVLKPELFLGDAISDLPPIPIMNLGKRFLMEKHARLNSCSISACPGKGQALFPQPTQAVASQLQNSQGNDSPIQQNFGFQALFKSS